MDTTATAETQTTTNSDGFEAPFSSQLFRCCEDWEHSQYDDSDWYCVAYDAKSDKLVRIQTWTTRYACTNGPDRLQSMTPDMEVKAKAALVRLYFGILRRQEDNDVNEPGIKLLGRGVRVVVTEYHRCMRKNVEEESNACISCGGSGKWTNPKRASDVRECFGCRGKGSTSRKTYSRAKGEDGKPVWEGIEIGSAGVVTGQATFGTFYRKGYNQPGRHNTTVYAKLDDGRSVQIPAKKLKLERQPATDAELMVEAEKLANEAGYYPPFRTSGVSLL